MAETSKFRGLILALIDRYMNGKSPSELDIIDIGSGDDPLTSSCDKFDLPKPYTTKCNVNDLTYKGDAREVDAIVKVKYDIVYSSHLLEDFPRNETIPILRRWCNILKSNGFLILLLPDQQRYEAACKLKNEKPNEHHQIKDFSLRYIEECVSEISELSIVFSKELFNGSEYNFLVAMKKMEIPVIL